MPVAIRAGLLMMLSQKMNHISKNYDFDIKMIKDIFPSFESMAKPIAQVGYHLID